MANSLISMIKGDSTLIDNTEVLDGQILFNTDDKTILLDDDDEREQYGGKSDTANPNIAYVEEGTTATRGYAKGQYVIVSGILYKALVQINSGTTFVVNTNIEQTTVGTELGRTITQEAYDLLPASEKNKGIWYITNSGDSYHVDNALSTTSTNPVQNKILTTEINKINADLTKKSLVNTYYDSSTKKLYQVNADGTQGGEISMGNGSIDFNNVLASFSSTTTYTVIEDCFLCGILNINNNVLSINGHPIASADSVSGAYNKPFIESLKLKTGDVVSLNSTEARLFVFGVIS